MVRTFSSYFQSRNNGLAIDEVKQLLQNAISSLDFRKHEDVLAIRKIREIFNEEVSDVVWFLLQSRLVKGVEQADPKKVIEAFRLLNPHYGEIEILNQGNG